MANDMNGSPQETLNDTKEELSEKTPAPRQSSRDCKPTSKMTELQDEGIARKERKSFKGYGIMKLKVKGPREAVNKETNAESSNDFVESFGSS